MSRVGTSPINIPSGVEVKLEGNIVKVNGPKGNLERKILDEAKVNINGSEITIEKAKKSTFAKAYHGTARQLIANMIQGVTAGFEKKLELVGLGYKAHQKGEGLTLALGYSHPIEIEGEKGVSLKVDGNTIVVSGIDKELVGSVAAKIKAKRVPDAYKGKGVRYFGENIKTKEGKKSK